MSDTLQQLKLKKLVSEHTYYKNEIRYKKELIRQAEVDFMQAVSKYLKSQPELMKQVNAFMNKAREESSISNVKDGVSEKEPPSDFEKKVFREISKVAHPDKTNGEDEKLTELYIEASDAYSSHDIITLYKMAVQLNLDVELNEEVSQKIETQITNMREETDFIEKNLAYQWILAITPEEKETVLNYYISNIMKK